MAEYTISIAETNGFASDVIRYIRDGFVVVPVKQDKRPGGPNHGKDWQNLRITEDEADAFWPEYPGVGWNAKASGLVIIDNDSEAARTLCRFVMEPRFGETLMSGRTSSRRNKYYYYCEWTRKPLKYYTGSYYHKDTDAPTRKKTPPLVELLTGNKQANVPPSPHPSGETLEWEGGYDPAKIVRVQEAEMLQAMKILGSATLLLDVMPGSGRRDIAFALAGFLLRNDRCTYEEVEEIFTLVWKYGLRSAEGLDDAVSILERTNTKLEAGDEDVSGGLPLMRRHPSPLQRRFWRSGVRRLDALVPGWPRKTSPAKTNSPPALWDASPSLRFGMIVRTPCGFATRAESGGWLLTTKST